MPLTRAEFQIRKRLPRRSSILLFDAACLLGWTTVTAIAELAGVPGRRRAELELAELVRKGWLAREERGPKNQAREVRYTARVAAIGADRTGAIDGDRTGVITNDRTGAIDGDRSGAIAGDRSEENNDAHARTRATDLPSRHVISKPLRPSVREGSGEGADGRTDGSKKFARVPDGLAASIADGWKHVDPSITPAVVRAVLGRFLAERPGIAERELQAYSRAALRHRDGRERHAAFGDISGVDRFFGQAFVGFRFDRWRASIDARPRESSFVQLLCGGCERLFDVPAAARGLRVKCKHCDTRTLVPASDAAPPVHAVREDDAREIESFVGGQLRR